MRAASVLESVLPRPREVHETGEMLTLPPGTVLRHSPEGERPAARLVEAISRDLGIELPAVLTEGAGRFCLSVGEAPDCMQDNDVLPADREGYCLRTGSSGALLSASTSAGLLWAAMTFLQMLRLEGGSLRAPGAVIRDWPRYRFRAFMIDSGRCPNSLPKIKRVIRICSAVKLNCLVFREGDDELNAVRYGASPLGSENPYALSMAEVEQMVRYAAEREISVVPEVESLGHSTAKGRHYPHLVSGGFEHDYGFVKHTRKSHLKPGDPESLALLRAIYEEWLRLLPKPMIHLGLDEVRLPMEVQARHMDALLEMIGEIGESCGRPVTPIVWSDAPPTPLPWQSRVVRCLWNYGDGEANGPDNPHLVKQGAPWLLSGGSEERVWMAGGSGSLHTPNSKSGYDSAVQNLLSWARWGEHARNAEGLLAVQWSGNATDDWLPDFLAAADFGWNVPQGEVNPAQQLARVDACLKRLEDAARPDAAEVDPPCWDGIWLDGGDWGTDIATGRRKG